jgi:hypothetical protein
MKIGPYGGKCLFGFFHSSRGLEKIGDHYTKFLPYCMERSEILVQNSGKTTRELFMTFAKRMLCTGLLLIGVTTPLYAADRAVSIEDFAFLTGYWKGTGFGGVSEEVWMPPSDGRMFGIFKQSSNGELAFTELLEITELDGEFVLRLKHFNPDFSAWEEKNDYLTFKLQATAPNKAVFAGLSYELTDANSLRIELKLRQASGEMTTEVFSLTRG